MSLTFSITLTFGQSDEYEVIRDLKLDWEFYSEKDQGYLPYISGNNISTKSINFHLPLPKYRNKFLIITFRPGSSLWINDRLVGYYPETKTVWFSIDSLIMNHVEDSLLVSVYDKASSFDRLVTVIGVKAPVSVSTKTVNEIFVREISAEKNSFIIIAFLIIAYFTLWYNVFPGDFKQMISLSSVFKNFKSSVSISTSVIASKPQLIFLIGLSSIIAFLLLIHQYIDDLSVLRWLLTDETVIWGWVLLTLLVFVALLLKYLLIIVLSYLFGIRDLAHSYFFGIIILSMIFYMFIFIVVVASGLSVYHRTGSVVQFLTIPVLFFYPLRLIFMFFVLRRNATVNFLHLFSYLCATELIPIIFGFKYLFQ